jgi:hypothetical protein
MAISLMNAAEEIAAKNKVEPLTNDYDESKSTASRVNDIISENSPLMQQARTAGTQLAASRGLTNSSLAGQAEQAAVIDKATPIAATDAQLSNTTSLANMAAKNQAALANAKAGTDLGATAMGLENSNLQQDKTLAQQADQFKVQAGQAQQQIDNQVKQFADSLGMSVQDMQLRRDTLTQQQQQYLAGLENQRFLAGLDANTKTALQKMSNDTQLKVAQIEASYKGDIQSSTNIAGAWSNTMTQIATIQNNPNLDQAAKETLIRNNIESFQSFAEFWKKNNPESNVDISDLLNFNIVATPGSNAPGNNNTGGYYYNGQYTPPGGGGGGEGGGGGGGNT